MRMHIEMVDRYKFIAQLDRMWEESNESLCLTIYIFQLFIKFSDEEKYYCQMSKQLMLSLKKSPKVKCKNLYIWLGAAVLNYLMLNTRTCQDGSESHAVLVSNGGMSNELPLGQQSL